MAAETGVELHPCLSKSPGQDDFLGDFVFRQFFKEIIHTKLRCVAAFNPYVFGKQYL